MNMKNYIGYRRNMNIIQSSSKLPDNQKVNANSVPTTDEGSAIPLLKTVQLFISYTFLQIYYSI